MKFRFKHHIIDSDGHPEVLSMSDPNGLWWHKIPDDPTKPWTGHKISPPVHGGLAVGDVTGKETSRHHREAVVPQEDQRPWRQNVRRLPGELL